MYKRNFVNSTGRMALVAAFLLGLFLPAVIRARDTGQLPAQVLQRETDGQTWLKIMVFADAPVVGANVRVQVGGPRGQLLVDAKSATNRQGVFPARVWRSWFLDEAATAATNASEPERRHRRRSFIRIIVSGGTVNGYPFVGRLTADIALTDPAHQILVVNPVTTLVSRMLDERPELKLDDAERRVRQFLKLPANYSLGLALRESSRYASPFFSHVAFMKEAQDAGGLNAFEHLLLLDLLWGSGPHSFRNSNVLKSADGTPASVIQAGLVAGLLDYAGSEGVASLAGWALSLTGLVASGTSDDEIAALTEALVNLQSSIDNLSSQVAQLTQIVEAKATQTAYTIITTQAQTLATQVNDEENRLMFFAKECPPVAQGSPQPPPSSYCTTEAQEIIQALSSQPIYSAYSNVENYVKDNGTLGLEGMLHLYSLWLGQSKQFFRPADSTKMQNLYDYWDGVLTQAADLRIELLHQEGEQNSGGFGLIALMGNPDATPATTGQFQQDQATNLKLIFPPVPAGTVINSADQTMWSINPWVHDWPPPGNVISWSPQPECQAFNSFPAVVNGIYTSPDFTSYLGFFPWEYLPTKAQWQAAFSLAPTNGSVQWRDWLVSQTKTTDDESPASPGFFDWTRVCATNDGAWTSTPTTLPNYWVINPAENSFYTLVPDGGPQHYAFYWPARTLGASEQYYWYQ